MHLDASFQCEKCFNIVHFIVFWCRVAVNFIYSYSFNDKSFNLVSLLPYLLKLLRTKIYFILFFY